MTRTASIDVARPPAAHIDHRQQHTPAAPAMSDYPDFPFPISAADIAPMGWEEQANHPAGSGSGPSPKGVSLFRDRVRSHPKPFFILGGLTLLLVIDIVGLVLYMMKVPGANDGFMTIINAMFVLAIVFIFAFMFRQAMILHRIFHPPTRAQQLSGSLPTWLTRLPTYRDVIRQERRMGRSTDQEGWKGDLPAYGDTKGSELLMKSRSRDTQSTDTGPDQVGSREIERFA